MEITEGEDFYFDEKGRMILTAKYLFKQGNCCGNGCRHCPFHYINVPEPQRSKILYKRNIRAQHPKDD